MTTINLKNTVLDGWLRVGEVGRPHGLKGAFFLKTPDRRTEWDDYPVVTVVDRNGTRLECKVTKSYLSGGMLALQLQEFTQREHVEQLYECPVFVRREDVNVSEDEVLVADLKGLQVYVEGRGLVGTVIDINDFGAQSNLEIKLLESGKTIFFPILDEFVASIDVEKGRVDLLYVPEFFEV